MIIGVTGTICCGKGEFTRLLVSKGFVKHAYGDVVREEAEKRGIEINRKNLQRLGDEGRKEENGIWAERLKKRIEKGKNFVVDGFRYPDQVEAFKVFDDFILISIDAPIEKRFEWSVLRKREENPKTIEEFKEADRRDLEGYKDGSGQNTEGCFLLAQEKIINGGSLQELMRKSEELLEKLKSRI